MPTRQFAFWPLAILLFVPTSPASAKALNAATVRQLVVHYQKAKSWAVQAIVLTALDRQWHPSASEIIESAMDSRDRRLRAYALEALRRADDATLRPAATKKLVDLLICKRLADNNKLFIERLVAVLQRLFPDANCTSRSAWKRWWSKRSKGYAPPTWQAPESNSPKSSGSAVPTYVTRALKLSEFGIELVICIDTTGSMQSTIDASRAGLKDIVAVLRGISPRFRIGLVTYNDKPAKPKLQSPLTRSVAQVDTMLGRLRANGGGDFPEEVDKGLEVALSRAVGWLPLTNKIIVIIGDAPPHPADRERANKLAASGLKFGQQGRGNRPVLSGGGKAKATVRPIITCAINCNRSPQTSGAFRDIAKAGGGAFEQLNQMQGKPDVSQMIERIITLSFGHGHASETQRFVKIYLEYRKALYFR